MSNCYEYNIECENFQEFENWDGEIDGTKVSFQREIEWDYAGYELALQEKINMNPQAFHKMFCEANSLKEDEIEVSVILKEKFPGLKVVGKDVRLEAPFSFSLTENDWAEPYFTGGRGIKPELPSDLPEPVKNKILETCEESSGWSPLEEIGLDAEHNGVDRSMTGFVIWEVSNSIFEIKTEREIS